MTVISGQITFSGTQYTLIATIIYVKTSTPSILKKKENIMKKWKKKKEKKSEKSGAKYNL